MSISSDEEWHYAKDGLFLNDEYDNIYGLTCKHVTLFPTDGKIYVKTHSGAMQSVGHVLNRGEAQELSDKTASQFQCDVDIFKVDSQFKSCCFNLRRRLLRHYRSVEIFKHSREVLFGLPVSSITHGKITVDENDKQSMREVFYFTDESEIMNDEGGGFCITGQIESDEIHETENADLPVYNILLQASGTLFNPGDSGTVIARENERTLELIGIVTGSFKSENRNKNYIICLLLKEGL